MRTMYDAVTPGNIPRDAQMVAGYIDGRYAWKPSDWALFPSAVHVTIAVFPSTNDGLVLDCESGDATPAQCPGWVQMRRAAGVDPSVYTSLSVWPQVRAAFQAAGVAEPHYWIAAYPGNGPNLYDGAVAHQYADPGPVDISVVADFWPGVDNGPVVHVGPVVVPAPRVASRSVDGNPFTLLVVDGGFGQNTIQATQWRCNVTADGQWGLVSKQAFQSRLGVTQDGDVGPNTIRALQRHIGVTPDGVWGPQTTMALQRALNASAF